MSGLSRHTSKGDFVAAWCKADKRLNPGELLHRLQNAEYGSPRPSFEIIHASDNCMLFLHSDVKTANAEKTKSSIQDSVVFEGYLTNHGEISDMLNKSACSDAISDARLIAELFKQQGLNSLSRLEGAYAYVLWDPEQRRLIAARDHFGRRALFFHDTSTHVYFSTSPHLLSRIAGIPKKLNHQHLAHIATDMRWRFDHKTTLFENISGVPAATRIIANNAGVQMHKFWAPDPVKRLPHHKEDDLWSEFRERLFRAVESNIAGDGPVISLFSGGLDSSAIVSVAARVLEKQNRSLTTLSAVAAHDIAGQPTERHFMDTLTQYPNIHQEFVSAPEGGPVEGLESAIRKLEHPFITSRHFLYSAFSERAKEIGGSYILDGAFGELGPTSHADGAFPEWLLSGQWPRLAREISARSTITGEGVWPIIRSNLIRPFVKRPVAEAPHPFSHVLNSSYINEYAPAPQKRARQYFTQLQHRQFQARNQTYAQQPPRRAILEGPRDADLRWPFLDRRLLEFCLAAPGTMKHRNGYHRYMIRRGLDGIMPSRNQWRTSKTPFSVDYATRYNLQRERAARYLRDISPGDPVREIVNIPKLLKMADSDMNDSRGDGHNSNGLHYVPAGLSLIAFLRSLDSL